MRLALLKTVTAMFVAAAALAGAGFYRTIVSPTADPANRPPTPWSPEAATANFALPDDAKPQDFPQTFERPLFIPSRRPFVPQPPETIAPPPVPEAQPTAQAAPDATGLQLKGVMLGQNTAKAFLIWPEAPLGQWLTVGSSVKGWELTKIEDDTVWLIAGSENTELKLYVDNPPD